MAVDRLVCEWFDCDRWDGSSAVLLPIEARGLYREMMTQAWRRGARLPKDHLKVQLAVRCTREEWERSWPLVAPYWREDGEWLVNDTQLEIYAISKAKADIAHEKAMKAAAASPQVRAKREREAKLEVDHKLHLVETPESMSKSPSESPSKSLSDGVTATKTTAHESEMLEHQRQEYARAVWEAWLARRGRGGPEMSSAEWDLVVKLMDGKVPLRVVLRGIQDCGGNPKRTTPLTYARPAIEDAYRQWQRAVGP